MLNLYTARVPFRQWKTAAGYDESDGVRRTKTRPSGRTHGPENTGRSLRQDRALSLT